MKAQKRGGGYGHAKIRLRSGMFSAVFSLATCAKSRCLLAWNEYSVRLFMLTTSEASTRLALVVNIAMYWLVDAGTVKMVWWLAYFDSCFSNSATSLLSDTLLADSVSRSIIRLDLFIQSVPFVVVICLLFQSLFCRYKAFIILILVLVLRFFLFFVCFFVGIEELYEQRTFCNLT